MSQRYLPGQPQQLPRHNQPMAGYQPEHFLLSVKDGVTRVTPVALLNVQHDPLVVCLHLTQGLNGSICRSAIYYDNLIAESQH